MDGIQLHGKYFLRLLIVWHRICLSIQFLQHLVLCIEPLTKAPNSIEVMMMMERQKSFGASLAAPLFSTPKSKEIFLLDNEGNFPSRQWSEHADCFKKSFFFPSMKSLNITRQFGVGKC